MAPDDDRAGDGAQEGASDGAGNGSGNGAGNGIGDGAAEGAKAAAAPCAGRLDRALVAAGLADSRARAQRLIEGGCVSVAGNPVLRPAQPVAAGAPLAVAPMAEDAWVSRGALKLIAALDRFGLIPSGHALDLGASTGGFSEVLLARGAARVTALDVGHGQLHPRLAADPRVTAIEGVNARAIPPGMVAPFDWLTADLSFISLTKALPGPLTLARPGATAVVLVKPQFEVGRTGIARGGIVRDPALRKAAVDTVAAVFLTAGWQLYGTMESPITGGDGNVEHLLAARVTDTG
ncbi:MAG: TlyA family RNA methyltransferase [Pseudomonadota bacterium]